MVSADFTTVFLLNDAQGALLAEFHHHPADSLLLLRWHGHLSADDVVRAARAELELQQQYQYRLLLNDKSHTTGDWGEALPLLQYEWLPQAKANGLQALAYVFSSDLEAQLVSEEFLMLMRPHLAVQLFRSPEKAWEWLVLHH